MSRFFNVNLNRHVFHIFENKRKSTVTRTFLDIKGYSVTIIVRKDRRIMQQFIHFSVLYVTLDINSSSR